MTPNTDNQELLRKYLLGALAGEAAGVAEQLMLDDELFQQLLIAEDELIDDYLRGKLPDTEVRQFEEHFLATPQHRQDLQFAETLLSYVSAPPEHAAEAEDTGGWSRPPWFHSLAAAFSFRNPKVGFALAASLLLLILGGVWVATRVPRAPELARTPEPAADNQPPPGPVVSPQPGSPEADRRPEGAAPDAPPQTAEQRPTPAVGRRQQNSTGTARNTRATPQVFTIALALGALRDGGGLKKISIPQQAATVRLRLALAPEADEFRSFRAALQTDAGVTLLSTEALSAGGARGARTASWDVPAGLLKRGDYEVVLSGRTPEGNRETLGRYNFRVLAR